jgi:hypothetical protein
MNLQQILEQHREMYRCTRANDIGGAEAIAVELAPAFVKLFDALDDRGHLLSWSCDR